MNYKQIAEKYTYHYLLGGRDSSGGIEQNKDEMLALVEFMINNKVKTVLEIGMGQGFLSKYLDECGFMVSGITDNTKILRWSPPEIFIGKSFEDTVYDKTGVYDLIIVDADHSYNGVKNDYSLYKNKCRFMAFHDMLGLRDCYGVRKLWNEIKDKYESHEIVCNDPKIAAGIGIIKTDTEKPEIIKQKRGPKPKK